MRASDLVVGQEYAYARSEIWGMPERATVLEVGVSRRVFRGWREVDSGRADGVRVRIQNTHNEDAREEVVPLAHIRRPWVEQVELTRKREEAEARERAHRERVLAEADRVIATLAAAGVRADRDHHGRVTINASDHAVLIAALTTGDTPRACDRQEPGRRDAA